MYIETKTLPNGSIHSFDSRPKRLQVNSAVASFGSMSTVSFSKHKVVAIGLLLLGAAAALVRLFPHPTIMVRGNLSHRDVSDIVRTVKRDIWRQAFPDFSWRTIQRTPRAMWAVATSRVSEVSDAFQNRAVVKGSFRLESRIAGPGFLLVSFGCDSWALRKDTVGWVVQSRSRARPSGTPHPAFSLPEQSVSFSAALSNESRLSFDRKP